MHKVGAERRLAAIMVADIVGYSRLMGADEAGTLRRLKALRREVLDPSIAAAHGRIVKTMGDGLLVEFPSPLRAVTCAVQIQRAMLTRDVGLPPDRQFRLRFGINVGDVVAETDGDLYGDGVNVAARLEPLAEPGGLCISRSVHDQVRDKLSYRFEDLGKRELKNIARPIGVFGLSAAAIQALPVQVAEDEPEEHLADPAGTAGRPARHRPASKRLLLTAGVATLLVAGGLGWWSWSTHKAPDAQTGAALQASSTPKPVPGLSLVVLPFANLSNDPEQDFFADGLTEDLTTDLSHLAGSFVIARNTAFTYKGKAVDVKQVGRDLGVRYVLEGSVRRTGERGVLNAQLISAETGAHIWADRFEGERSRLGELQVEFVARLARSLDVQLTEAESLRALRERPDNPTAADLAMRGWAALNRPRTKANSAEARTHFERSLQIDSENPQSKIGLARAIAQQINIWASQDIDTDTSLAKRLALEGLEARPQSPMAHYVLSEVLRTSKEFERGLREVKIAIEYDQNMSIAYALAGITNLWAGRAKDLFELVERAMRLSPKDTSMSAWEYYICHAHTHLGHWEKTLEWCNRSVEHTPYWAAYVDLAAAYAWLGRNEDAQEAVKQILNLMPGYTVQKWVHADWSRNPTFLAEYQRIIEGLRKAGLPEGEAQR
ncbi:adenylate/guanylate cyclase domain-containing protein [Methylobacterium nigriterrae]|uniref:adenylate/guanylate cyclase domain-containing protein n=1 Tax=Methylobacterium nigriterrae TaxID=3127512 RepID=UPI0030137DBE